jgi:hypothetical protein
MTVESQIYNALKGLVTGQHVYAITIPDTVTARTYITYQQVGGDAVNFLDSAKPGKKNARFQVNVWAPTAHQAAALSRLTEDAMRTINSFVLGAPVSTSEPDLNIFGTRQDFSIWFDD